MNTGNLGNILIIIIPAVCKEKGTPFGDADVCSTYAMAYASLSMAVCKPFNGGMYAFCEHIFCNFELSSLILIRSKNFLEKHMAKHVLSLKSMQVHFLQ